MFESLRFWIGFGCGLFIGVNLGVLILGLCLAAKKGDTDARDILSQGPKENN